MMKLIKWKSNFGCRKIFQRYIVGNALFCVFFRPVKGEFGSLSESSSHIPIFSPVTFALIGM